MNILFPSSYEKVNMPDLCYAKEYEAASKYFDVILFDQCKWDTERVVCLSEKGSDAIAIYRGWMMEPDEYDAFYQAVKRKGIRLITGQEQYVTFHLFNNAYPLVERDTPKALFFRTDEKIDKELVNTSFDRFLIKDFVKSAKNTGFPMCIKTPVTQDELDALISEFIKNRDDLFTGGICMKQFVDLKKYSGRSNEFRVFYANGKILSVCRNSLQPAFTNEPPRELIEKYQNLNSPFYTIDYAEAEDGSWFVVEAGDGGVSGLSEEEDYGRFFRKLSAYFAVDGHAGEEQEMD